MPTNLCLFPKHPCNFSVTRFLSGRAKKLQASNSAYHMLSPLLNRRQFMGQTMHGLSGIALASILADSGLLAADRSPARPQIDPAHPFAARPAHFAPKAKQVLLIFCSGRL